MKILKFPLVPQTGLQGVNMPGVDARPIAFGEQRGVLMFWAEVDEKQPRQLNRYWLAFTGQDVPVHGKHVGSVAVESPIGQLVWHLYKL